MLSVTPMAPAESRFLRELCARIERQFSAGGRYFDKAKKYGLPATNLFLIDLHEESSDDVIKLLGEGRVEVGDGSRVQVIAALLTSEDFIHDWNADPRLKGKQFFVQAALSYGIARVVSYRDLPAFLDAVAAGVVTGKFMDETGKVSAHHGLVHGLRAAKTCAGRMVRTFFKVPHRDSEAVHRTITDEPTFVRALAAAYHIGRHRRAEFYARREIPWLGWRTNSRKFAEAFEKALLDDPEHPDLRSISLRRRSFHLLRDLSRVIATGRTTWAGAEQEVPIATDSVPPPQAPAHILLLDDHLKPDWSRTVEVLGLIQDCFWQNVVFDVATAETWIEFADWLQSEWFGSHARTSLDHEIRVRPLDVSSSVPVAEPITSFAAILVDVQIEGRERGPEIIKWLQAKDQLARLRGAAADRQRGAALAGVDGDAQQGPTIIIVTSARGSENIQLCLNLGIATYVFKDRLIGLPAWIPPAPKHPPRRRVPSGFASIKLLPPRVASALATERIDGRPEAYDERAWLRRLPKTDLHYHIGTSIGLASIAAMAHNTAGYSYTSLHPTSDLGPSEIKKLVEDPPESLKRTLDKACNLVWLATLLRRKMGLGPAEAFWKAAHCLGDVKEHDGSEPPLPPSGVFGTILGKLAPPFRPVRNYEVTAAVVAALTSASFTSNYGRWEVLDTLKAVLASDLPAKELAGLRGVASRFIRTAGEAAAAWSNQETKNCVLATFPPDCDSAAGKTTWSVWEGVQQRIRTRVDIARTAVGRSLRGARDRILNEQSVIERLTRVAPDGYGWMREDDAALLASLTVEEFAHLVRAPSGNDLRSHTLQRYLVGADLLGADHLQYAENILLAGIDIVEQNVLDNVLYSEIRCATTGYAAAGLGSLSATDLLCHAFDLASFYFAHRYKHRWVRINVLLGAKRHKDERNVKDVVALLESYRQRYTAPHRDEATPEHCPRWWRPCRVIGFDLSGDEATQKRLDLEGVLAPLFESCAAITIHAGEAASAQSIWEAVYKQRARRIGHGLRLREHARLMEYCVTEGICLELCPISNGLTNVFRAPPARRDLSIGGEGSRHDYPLPAFLSADVPVCINTDNRFLHESSTVTDEYLRAAELSGGLSRLEVLDIAKSGFKHAFLPKDEQIELLSDIDEMIFRLLKEEDEETNGPEGA